MLNTQVILIGALKPVSRSPSPWWCLDFVLRVRELLKHHVSLRQISILDGHTIVVFDAESYGIGKT